MESVILELLQIIGPVGVAIGYVRGRLNGLISQVQDLSARVDRMEYRYAKCRARVKAEAE